MNHNRMTAVQTYDMEAQQSSRPMINTHVDTQLMKNIVLLLIGGLLFILCYRVSRRQTAYVNANQASVQPVQVLPQEPMITHTNPSLVMRVARL